MVRPIRLRPQEIEAPTCEQFTDPAVVRTYERAMREHRARTEPWVLSRDDDRPDTTWRVQGGSGSTWRVDLVDGDRHDGCDCPDFLGNRLGTCKHLEAVRKAVAARAPLRRAMRSLAHPLQTPVLTVDATRPLTLVTAGRWTSVRLRSLGLTGDPATGAVTVERVEAVQPGMHHGVRVTHAAAAVAVLIARRAALARRREAVTEALDRGRMGLDILAEPLFPYQVDGVRHLLSAGRALLADDMGLGKTVQALAACEALRRRGEAARILVVTSASLKDQWAREIKRYTGEHAVVVGGGMAARHEAFVSDAPYKVLNYELTWRELTRLQRLDADVLVLDEAQRARNFRTRTAATLRDIPSRFLFVLTGTPVENRLDDLYSLLQLVDPEVLGPLWEFNLQFHIQNARGRVEGYRNLSALRAQISPVVLRRRKEEVLTQLPPVTEQTRYIPMAPQQAEMEAGLRADASRLMKIAEHRSLTREERERVLRLLLKARQACNALELCDPLLGEKASPKLDEFEALVGEIVAQGSSKVLVFSEWTGMLRLAAARLDALGVQYALLHGGVATDRRPAVLDRFREHPEVRVLLSTDAGGVGLNLQVATYVVHLDLPWNPARLDQRTARAHRLGQTRGVSVTYLCAETGIERGIEGTLASKRAVRSAALDLSSTVETVVASSFTAFLNQLRAAMEAIDAEAAETTDDARPPSVAFIESTDEAPVAVPDEGTTEELPGDTALPVEPTTVPPEATPETTVPDKEVPETAGPETTVPETIAPETAVPEPALPETVATVQGSAGRGGRARDRLRLAQVVLDAGFPSDAVRASYEALRAAITELFDGRVFESHPALVGAIYRELIPHGRLAPAAHGVLARLHDLASLDIHGVAVDGELAREAVREASEWVDRLGPGA